MAKNERIIAQDLAEIKHAIQVHDTDKIQELCNILTKEIKKYPVTSNLIPRLEIVSRYSNISLQEKSLEEKTREIDDLVDILTSNK